MPFKIIVTPAYGRDYRNEREIQADWDANKDFDVADSRGMKINKEDAENAGLQWVNVRYQGNRKVYPIKVAHLRMASDTFAGIDIRSFRRRQQAAVEAWWDDLEAFIKEWWSFNKVTSRRGRGMLTVHVNRGGGTARDVDITVKGQPIKPTVYVWAAEKTFGPDDSLETIMYWIDGITRPGASSSSYRGASTIRVTYRHLEKLAHREKVALRIKQFKNMLNLGNRFGVLSAYGPGPKSENQIRHGKLVAELQKRGYRKMTPLKGKWEGVAEKSILVPQMKFHDLIDLGRMFDQISVIYKSADNIIGMYYLRDKTAEVAVEPSGEMAAEIAADPSLWSKARGVSFEFGFLWGDKIPWDGRTPIQAPDLEALVAAK